uniref:glucuronosyltransferase n=1 Tax=Heterorhabditis bacteriophora TaxID=37862 RepID=A0A1I7WE52_HETBA
MLFLLLALSLSSSVYSLTIAFYLSLLGKSHLDFASALINILVERGHEVDLIIARHNSLVKGNGTAKVTRVIDYGFLGSSPWMESEHLRNPFNPPKFTMGFLSNFEDVAHKLCRRKKYDAGITSDYEYCGMTLFKEAGIDTVLSYASTNLLPGQALNIGLPSPIGGVTDCKNKISQIYLNKVGGIHKRFACFLLFILFDNLTFTYTHFHIIFLYLNLLAIFFYNSLFSCYYINDKRVVAFISHMGLNSFLEASYAGVPLVAIPLFADQSHNANIGVKSGTTVMIQKTEVTVENMVEALRKILYDKSYRANAKRIARLLHEKPENVRDQFVKWVEFAAAHKKLHNILNLPGNDMGIVEYYGIDCVAALIFILVFSLSIGYSCVFSINPSTVCPIPFKENMIKMAWYHHGCFTIKDLIPILGVDAILIWFIYMMNEY